MEATVRGVMAGDARGTLREMLAVDPAVMEDEVVYCTNSDVKHYRYTHAFLIGSQSDRGPVLSG